LDEEQAADPTPDGIRAMHDLLLASYAAILLRSSQLPAVFSQERWEVESRRQVGDLGPIWRGLVLLSIPFDAVIRIYYGPAARFLVQPFIESHISRRLTQLDRAYLYFTHVFPASLVLPPADWLVAARAQVRDLNETLKSWTSVSSLLRFLGPPAVGILVATLGGAGVGSEELLLLGWAVGLTAFYASFIGASSFRSKRSLFLLPTPETIGTTPENTYRAEIGLWAALDLRRRPEPAIDEILHVLTSVVYAMFSAAVVAFSLDVGLKTFFFGVLACGFLAAALVSLKAAAIRQPR
jgi:hypothetical protein